MVVDPGRGKSVGKRKEKKKKKGKSEWRVGAGKGKTAYSVWFLVLWEEEDQPKRAIHCGRCCRVWSIQFICIYMCVVGPCCISTEQGESRSHVWARQSSDGACWTDERNKKRFKKEKTYSPRTANVMRASDTS